MSQTVGGAVSKFIVRDVFFSILGFPIWWYTRGFLVFTSEYIKTLRMFGHRFGVWIWIKNLFTPMYGSSDFSGRIISFFIRLMQIIVRSIGLVVTSVLATLVFFLWIFLPVLAIAGLVSQLSGLLQGL